MEATMATNPFSGNYSTKDLATLLGVDPAVVQSIASALTKEDAAPEQPLTVTQQRNKAWAKSHGQSYTPRPDQPQQSNSLSSTNIGGTPDLLNTIIGNVIKDKAGNVVSGVKDAISHIPFIGGLVSSGKTSGSGGATSGSGGKTHGVFNSPSTVAGGLGAGATDLKNFAGVDTRLMAAADYASQKTGERYYIPSGQGGTRTQEQADANAKAGIGVSNSLHIADANGVGHATDIMTIKPDGSKGYATPAFAAAMAEYGKQNGYEVRWGNTPGFNNGRPDPVHFDTGLGSRMTGKAFTPTAVDPAPASGLALASQLKTPDTAVASSQGWWTPERKEQAKNYFMKENGLPELGARALVTRMADVESIDKGPYAVNPTTGAMGIHQALGERKTGLVLGDFTGQLKRVSDELKTSEAAAMKQLVSAQNDRDAAIGAAMFERADGWDPAHPLNGDNWVDKTVANMNWGTPSPEGSKGLTPPLPPPVTSPVYGPGGIPIAPAPATTARTSFGAEAMVGSPGYGLDRPLHYSDSTPQNPFSAITTGAGLGSGAQMSSSPASIPYSSYGDVGSVGGGSVGQNGNPFSGGFSSGGGVSSTVQANPFSEHQWSSGGGGISSTYASQPSHEWSGTPASSGGVSSTSGSHAWSSGGPSYNYSGSGGSVSVYSGPSWGSSSTTGSGTGHNADSGGGRTGDDTA